MGEAGFMAAADELNKTNRTVCVTGKKSFVSNERSLAVAKRRLCQVRFLTSQ